MHKYPTMAYPDRMGWLPFMAYSDPGAMIWIALENATTGEKTFGFVIREESHLIHAMQKMPSGGIPIIWRFGVMVITIKGGKRIPIVIVMTKAPGGISEATINVLHLDDELLSLLNRPVTVLFVGDSGSVERALIFTENKDLMNVMEISRKIYDSSPWTDKEFDEAKEIYNQESSLEELWEKMGKK